MVEHPINSLIAATRAIGGERAVIADPALIEPWLTDWRGLYHGAARAILAPASTAQASAIVAAARQLGVALVPQGGNTSMVGGATPPADGSALILTTRRLRHIRTLADDMAVVEAGVILSELHDAAAERGRRFPLSLAAKGSATIGGLVSTNAGGTQVLRFGTMRRLVLGIEAVLPDGSIHDGLAPLAKDARGYDLNQLLVGAEGTLGLVTAAAVRLVPALRARAVGWVGVAGPHAALALLRALQAQAGDVIESFELLPAESLAAVLRHVPGTRAPLASQPPWHVLVEIEGDGETLAALLGEARVGDATIAASDAQASALWRLRETISEAERATGPAVQHDIAVPVDAMPDFMVDAARAIEAAFPGTHASGFGHLGDGNVHFHVRAPAGAPPDWRARDGAAASRMVHDLVVAAGGTIAAEHGIGQLKRAELLRVSPPARIAALRAIRHAFDPGQLMNPGKLVPLASDGECP